MPWRRRWGRSLPRCAIQSRARWSISSSETDGQPVSVTCKLTRGAYSIDLRGLDLYALATGFIPPAISETATIAVGTSANQDGGGRKIDERLLPRDYSFSVRVSGNSTGQIKESIKKLDKFLRSGTDENPVYFLYREDGATYQ